MANFRKSIEGAKASQVQAVEIPAWPLLDDNGQVVMNGDGKPKCTHFVRMMKLGELQAFHLATQPFLETNQVRCGAELLVRTLSDDEGNRLFQDSEAEVFEGLDWSACRIAIEAARKFNGLEEKSAKN